MQILQPKNIADIELNKYMFVLTTTTWWTYSSHHMGFVHSYTEQYPTREQSQKTKNMNAHCLRDVNSVESVSPRLQFLV